MPFEAEKIDLDESKRLALLREQGVQQIDECIKAKIDSKPILDQVAILSNTGRLKLFYQAVGEARLQGCSWLRIANAAKGATLYKETHYIKRNYLSYCKNNGLEPVKIRKSK